MNSHQQASLRHFAFGDEYTGTLLHKAEARTRLVDGPAHAVPVVCLDVELDDELRTRMHVECPYPRGHHTLAQADAARLKRGMRVRIKAPAIDMRVIAPNATEITPLPNPNQ